MFSVSYTWKTIKLTITAPPSVPKSMSGEGRDVRISVCTGHTRPWTTTLCKCGVSPCNCSVHWTLLSYWADEETGVERAEILHPRSQDVWEVQPVYTWRSISAEHVYIYSCSQSTKETLENKKEKGHYSSKECSTAAGFNGKERFSGTPNMPAMLRKGWSCDGAEEGRKLWWSWGRGEVAMELKRAQGSD